MKFGWRTRQNNCKAQAEVIVFIIGPWKWEKRCKMGGLGLVAVPQSIYEDVSIFPAKKYSGFHQDVFLGCENDNIPRGK